MNDYGILTHVPELTNNPDKVKEVVTFLEEVMGVPNQCSLKDVEMDDLIEKDLLKRGAARKLIKAWRKESSAAITADDGPSPNNAVKNPSQVSSSPVETKNTIPVLPQESARKAKANEDNGPKRIVYGNVGGDANFRDKIGTQNNDPVDNRKYENKYDGGHTETNYNAAVDQSQHNTKYGDHAQVGGTRNTTEVKLSGNSSMNAGNLNIGQGNQNITNAPGPGPRTTMTGCTFDRSSVNQNDGDVKISY